MNLLRKNQNKLAQDNKIKEYERWINKEAHNNLQRYKIINNGTEEKTEAKHTEAGAISNS